MEENWNGMSIDKLETVRKLLKDLFVYGCYSGEEYQKRIEIAKRTYDKEIKRLSLYIQKERRGLQRQGRSVIHQLYYDRYENAGNFLYAAYKMKQYKLSHLSLYMQGLQILNQLSANEWITISQFKEQVNPENKEFDKKAIEDFLKDLEKQDVLQKRNHNNRFEYRLKENLFDEFSEEELIELYYLAELFAGKSLAHSVAAYSLQEKISSYLWRGNNPLPRSAFVIQYHFLQGILNEEIIWRIQSAIHQKKRIKVETYKRRSRKNPYLVIEPVKLVVEYMYGRQYLNGRNIMDNCMLSLRIDRIKSVEIMNDKIKEISTVKTEKKGCLVEIDFYYEEKEYIRKILENEKQSAEIEEIDEFHCVYRTFVRDPRKLKPWIRSFGSSARIKKSTQHTLYEEMKKEWKRLEEKYGTVFEES